MMSSRTAVESAFSLDQLDRERRERGSEDHAERHRCICKAPAKLRRYGGVWTCGVCLKPMVK
jgi:ribosomal protein L37AE/L43A